MRKLDIYIIRKFLGTFFYAISLLIIIVIIFDISENIDEFLEKDAPLGEIIFVYYLNFVPYFVNLFVYLFTFISVIFFTSKLAGNTEIVAFLSSGISFNRLLRPYFVSAIFLAAMSFYLANFVIPVANKSRRVFKDKYMENLDKNKDRNIHMQISPGTYVYVENYNASMNIGYKFSMEKFEGEKLVYKMNAERLKWDTINESWKIEDFYIRRIDSLNESLEKGKRIDTNLILRPRDLYYVKEDFEEMNIYQLNDHIYREKMKGSETIKEYEMEKHRRLASPFATLVMTLIGVSLSSRKIRGGIGMHLGLGIGLAFTFILFMQVSTVFATQGNLSPAIAAWIPNVIYGIVGVILVRTAPK